MEVFFSANSQRFKFSWKVDVETVIQSGIKFQFYCRDRFRNSKKKLNQYLPNDFVHKIYIFRKVAKTQKFNFSVKKMEKQGNFNILC